MVGNKPPQENFLTSIGGCFECYMYRDTGIGWLKKERKNKKKMTNDYNSRPFQVCCFEIVTRYYYYCRLGQALYKLLDVAELLM